MLHGAFIMSYYYYYYHHYYIFIIVIIIILYYFMVEYNTKSKCLYNFQKYLFTLLHNHLFIYTLHALYTQEHYTTLREPKSTN